MKRFLFISLMAAFLLAACGLKQSGNRSLASDNSGVPAMGGGGVEAPYAMPMATMAPAPMEREATSGGQQPASVERLVIQNADLAIVVADVDARMKAIEAMAVEMGGYVVSSNRYQTQTGSGVEVPEAQVVVRIPAEKLDTALDTIKKDVVEVQSESRTGQDVTADYVDLQSRLKNLEATEAQLVKILESATKTEDVLNVFNQLTSIREQIELVKGQMKYYEESAALSAVSVRIIAEAGIQPIEVGGWKPQGVARDAIQSLVYFLQDFANFLIRFVLYLLPALILIGIPLYLVFLGVRAVFRKLRKPKVQPPVPPVEEEPKK